jgi:hypothetical protein
MALFYLELMKIYSCIILALTINDREKNRLTAETIIHKNRIKAPQI